MKRPLEHLQNSHSLDNCNFFFFLGEVWAIWESTIEHGMNRKGKTKWKVSLPAVPQEGSAEISKGCTCFGWHFFGEEMPQLDLVIGGLH